MKRKALAIALLATVTAGTALAFNYGGQDRREGQEREREARQERDVRREQDVRRERPNIHPLGMALELQNQLGLNEEQVKRFQDMWAEYKEVQQHSNARLQELEQEMAAIRRELGQFQEEQAGAVFESLGPDQRDMLRNHLREFNQRFDREREGERDVRREGIGEREFAAGMEEIRAALTAGRITEGQAEEMMGALRQRLAGGREGERDVRRERDVVRERERGERREGDAGQRREGGQEREFERAVAELRAAVAAGRMTAGEAEERIAAMRQRMGGGERRPKNLIGQHPMAYALEGARKIGLTERQVMTLQDAWKEIYAEGAELSGALHRLEQRAAELREAGEWNDRTAQEVNEHGRAYIGQLEELTAVANDILADNLNKEQMNGVEELMAAAKKREGGLVNPMNGHAMAWALELHETLKLNEKQIGTLKEAYSDLRREGDGLNERQAGLQRRMAELREAGRMTDGAEREFEAAMKNIGADREAIQAKATEILTDTLNREQLAQLREIMADRGRNDG